MVLVLSLFSFETKGQIGSVYPVDLNVMLTPPYGTCLTDLSNSNRFVIQALLRDMNHGNNYEMLIQMRVKSLSSMNTVFLSYSNKFSIGMGKPAVVLGAGNTPVSISNFFESGNVLIGQNILNDNCLPEGAYLFCFQAFDAKAYYAKQRIPISKEFTVTAFLENGATPILISPANNDSLSCQLPNVIFQWQQPYITSGINSYTLQVAEANSPFDGPQIIENGGNLLIEKRGLMMPICDIPVTEANFKENHTYYWRVVMCDKDGKARASYPNKGASPVYKFVYCGTPQEPEPEDAWVPQIPMAKSIKKSLDRLRIDTVLSEESSCSAFWFQDPMDVREKYDGVVIEVKKKNQDTWTPFLMESKVATDTLVALSSLAYKETYMARGQYFLYEDGEKVYAPYSDTIEFKIPHPADTLECGNAVPELTDCTNAGERAEMEIGDVFNANGTTVSIDTITNQSVNGSSVIISGEGHLPFPILSKFGLKVSFDNIEINCADELKKGQVISVYDEKTAAMIDLNNILGKGAAGNDLKQEDASLTEVGPDDDLSGFKSGDLIVEDGKVSLIVGNGNVVQVGTVIDLSNSDAYNDNGALNDEDIYVKFSNPDHENIAFDDDPTGMIRRAATLSDKYVSFGEEYIIPWVATNPGRIFQLTAMPSKDLSKSGFTDVKFVLPASGTHVVLDAVENGDGSYSVSIPGMKVDVQNHVYAIARKGEGSPYENVGKLNLCCYSYKSKKVVIVPLLEGLSVNTDEVKKDLDRVYAKLGYTFEVELDDDVAHREGLSTTIGLETDFLSDFSDEMKELIFNYEINIGDAYDKDAAYLFLLDKPTGKHKAAAGIMPQKQQYGFIFMREVTSATPSITHTMAHELGHGIFGLDHIFSGVYGIEEGATYNLMDYTEKTPNDALSYHEWTQINRPLPNWSALSRAEEDMKVWMSRQIFEGVYTNTIKTLFGDYPELENLFTGSRSISGNLLGVPATMDFANTIQSIKSINENDSTMELFSVALIAGIIYSASPIFSDDKSSIRLEQNLQQRTETNNSGRTINLGNPQNDSLYGIRVSYISLNPNSTSVSIDDNDIIKFTDEDYRFSFVHEIVHSKLWVEQSNVQLTPMQSLSIQAGTTAPPSSTENLIQNMINVKYNYDCAIQIDNFIRMYMYRKQNNTTDVSDCIVRTTRGHHNWPEDIPSTDRSSSSIAVPPNYHLTLPQLIELPENIFSSLISDDVFEALKGVDGNGKKITVYRNMIPEKYRTSYYGYR